MAEQDELIAAVVKDDTVRARAILDHDPHLLRMRTPNGTLVLTAVYHGANTALGAAVAGDHPELVKALLAARGDPNVRSEANYTPLHKAAAHGNLAIVQMLLDAGADPKATRDDGSTPIADARKEGHEAVVRLLQTRGA